MIGILSGREAMTEAQAAQLAPLTLAYVGDSVFDLFVRTVLIQRHTGNAGALHKKSVKMVNARAQAAFGNSIRDGLTERELNIFMRGRNAKSATVPKNMSVSDYKHATAVEALVGYLYLTGQNERLNELLGGMEFENGTE
ncbi:Mini-ribonuclease 3 [Christensenellaceae bacterium OttesenSCG-928-K19]|nr:Mini-ribonuclease 3 [Christensenellaceae bacterium OttesenSCG-928-K19]